MELQPNEKKIHMYIAGEEVVCSNQITLVEEITNANTIVLNNCYPLSWEQTKDYTQFYTPKDYSLFKIVFDYSNFNLATESGEDILTEAGQTIEAQNSKVIAFVGIVKRNQPMSLNPNHPHYATLQILDFKTFLNEGDLFNFVITETTVENFINTIIGAYSGYNFIVGNLNLSETKLNQTVGNYSCDQKTLFDILQYISQITSSIWKVRYVDEATYAIDFYDLDMLPQGMDLNYNTEYFDTNSIVDIKYTFNTNDYRNKQVLTADSVITHTANVEWLKTDSNNNEYELDNNIGIIITAYLDDEEILAKTTEDEKNGATGDLYYTVGSNKIKLNLNVLPTQDLRISYYPMLTGNVAYYNKEEINRINNQLNNTGIISRYENRKDATSEKELYNIAQTYIQFKGKEDITLQVKTINKDLWNIGQVVNFSNDSENGLIDLVGQYLVKKKTMQIYQNNADNTAQIFYTYELNNNFNFENELNYFDNQRAKKTGNIKDGEFINKYMENVDAVEIIFEEPVVS